MIISTRRTDSLRQNRIDVYLPLPKVNIFKPKDEFTINRVLDGFIMRRVSIDSKNIMKLHKNMWVRINRGSIGYELEGNYELEEIDEDTLKFTKI